MYTRKHPTKNLIKSFSWIPKKNSYAQILILNSYFMSYSLSLFLLSLMFNNALRGVIKKTENGLTHTVQVPTDHTVLGRPWKNVETVGRTWSSRTLTTNMWSLLSYVPVSNIASNRQPWKGWWWLWGRETMCAPSQRVKKKKTGLFFFGGKVMPLEGVPHPASVILIR